MTHSEWLEEYRKQNSIILDQVRDLKTGLEESIIECLRRNDNKPIKLSILYFDTYHLTDLRITEDWRIVIDTDEELSINWNAIDTTTKINIYEACIKSLNLE